MRWICCRVVKGIIRGKCVIMEQIKKWVREIEHRRRVPSDIAQREAWRRELVKELRHLLGLKTSEASRGALETKIVRSWCHHNLTAHRLTVSPPGELAWEAVILEPPNIERNERRPGWVCLHGHLEGGMSSITRLAVKAAGGQEALERYNDDYAYHLAQQGYVTISFDLPGFGGRIEEGPSSYVPMDHHVLRSLRLTRMALSTLALGRTYMGWCVENAMSALGVLQQWPRVDPQRIGIIGFSMGGTLAMLMAALDRRVHAAVMSGRFNQELARVFNGHMRSPVEVVPRLAARMEDEDIMAAAVPKRLYVHQEVYDNSIQAKLNVLEKVYNDHCASHRLRIEYSTGEHRFAGHSAYRWITRNVPIERHLTG